MENIIIECLKLILAGVGIGFTLKYLLPIPKSLREKWDKVEKKVNEKKTT